jgi:hypothetical protein
VMVQGRWITEEAIRRQLNEIEANTKVTHQ